MGRMTYQFSKRFLKIFFSRFILTSVVLCTIFISLAAAFFFVDPVGFRKIIFQPTRELILFQNELGAISHLDKIQKFVAHPTKEVVIPSKGKDGLRLVADLYIPEGQGPAPSLLLLHGSDPWGRKAGLIQLLALRFKSSGWLVLAPDARGFGESADPQEITSPEAWSVKDDIRRSINYLLSQPGTDSQRLHVLGHSLGAGHALEGALNDPRVRSLVLIGPPRFLDGRKTSLWKQVRFAADRGLKQPVPEEVAEARIMKLDISVHLKRPPRRYCDKPILLIDGELEGDANLAFLAKITRGTIRPLNYLTLPDTGHYCGVRNLFGSDTIYYRPDLFNPFMELVKNFFKMVEADPK